MYRDHPRIRGEHGFVFEQMSKAEGIIPAYAGSTISGLGIRCWKSGSSPHTRGAHLHNGKRSQRSRDHPRIRGEHGLRRQRRLPPRRIIPAYAGSTQKTRLRPMRVSGSSPHTRGALANSRGYHWQLGDHPRIRGEHIGACHVEWQGHGIIPAYAGSTARRGNVVLVSVGSSPHTRGARRR